MIALSLDIAALPGHAWGIRCGLNQKWFLAYHNDRIANMVASRLRVEHVPCLVESVSLAELEAVEIKPDAFDRSTWPRLEVNREICALHGVWILGKPLETAQMVKDQIHRLECMAKRGDLTLQEYEHQVLTLLRHTESGGNHV